MTTTLDLINYIVEISSHRDRNELNGALINAINGLMKPTFVTLYRCYQAKEWVAFACAGTNNQKKPEKQENQEQPEKPENEIFVNNSYVPQWKFCKIVSEDALLEKCWKSQKMELQISLDKQDKSKHQTRIVIPVIQNNQTDYIIDISVPRLPVPEKLEIDKGLIKFFSNFTTLLDYGETDVLTALPNRQTFEKHFYELLDSRDSNDQPLLTAATNHWLAIVDIDFFKNVNDSFGHMIGDEVLIMLARTLRESFIFTDHVFRYGGEEFLILLQPCDSLTVEKTFNRLRESISEKTFSRVGKITVSIGYTKLDALDTPDSAVDRADEAMSYSKQHGRNLVSSYESLVDSQEIMAKDFSGGDIELF